MIDRLSPDVVVLDVRMPGRDGLGLLRELRHRPDRPRVLVLSSFAEEELVLEAVRAGADGYLLKEVPAEELIASVRAVAAGASPLDPVVARTLVSEVCTRTEDVLTEREWEVLEMVRHGMPNKAIARRLCITERTVKAHVTHIFRRIGVCDRTQAALWAERHQWPVHGGTSTAVLAEFPSRGA
jgi:DNA-binding NarL/FixJ family response regulator